MNSTRNTDTTLAGSFLNHAGIGRSRHAWLKEYPPSIVNELEIIRQKFLKRYRFGQLLLPYNFAVQSKNRMENDTGDIAWVLRMSHQYSTAWQAGQNYYAARHPALERGSLMAVVGTNGLYATERVSKDVLFRLTGKNCTDVDLPERSDDCACRPAIVQYRGN